MSIPIISPIEIALRDQSVRRLPAPEYTDYEIHALPAAEVASTMARSPARTALEEIEHAAQISEYHDFSWWDDRLRTIRAALERAEGHA